MTPPADEPTAALLGGRYVLHECIGQGAMSTVYRAEDVVLGRPVAIKMLREAPDGAAVTPRARTEMALLASLNHPSLVTLYDAMVEPGQPEYLVMELIEGSTLAAEIAQGPMDADQVAVLAGELASALHIVHSAGIVHRDIKPSNVLMATDPIPGRRPRAKLADFGVAHLVDGQRLTSPGLVVGTAAYLAPEQVRGAAPAPPADIYALGLVLREALTGERAYPDATGIGAIMARLVDAPELPEWLGPEWTGLLRRMVSADPAERPDALQVMHEAAAMPTAATASRRSAPPVPPLPPLPADVAASSPAPDAAPLAPTRELHRRDRVSRRRRVRTRTLVIAGAALAAVAVLGVNAATWVGSVTDGPAVIQSDPSPDVSEAPEPVAVPAGDVERATDVTSTVDETDAGAVADDLATGEKAAPRTESKAEERAARADTKAKERAARDDRKAAERADHEQRKAEERAAREARKAERERERKERGNPGRGAGNRSDDVQLAGS